MAEQAAPPVVDGHVRLGGRNRENRLVHVSGPAHLVGRLVQVRIDRAGPYSLTGTLVAPAV